MGSEERRLPGDVVGRAVGAVTTRSVRYAKLVVIVTLLGAIALGAGMKNTVIDQELSDGLPDSNPNKLALDRVMDKLPGVSTLEAVLLELDPEKTDIRDIRHQDAIRAEDELWLFLEREVPSLTGGVGLHHVVKQVRVVAHQNDESFYTMPDETPAGRAEFDALWAIANNTVRSNIELTIRNPDYQSTVLAIQYDTDELDSDVTKDIGAQLLEATAKYRAHAEAGTLDQIGIDPKHDIFRHEYVYNIGPQSGLAKFESHLQDELPIFVPAAFLFIFMALFIGLRNPGTAVIGIVTLGIASIATVGLLGWLKIPFTSQNIAMIPLIVGNGIDYAIHVLNEYSEERSKGHSLEETFRIVGGRAGVAMVLATTTSVAGILALLFAESVSLRQLAISASFAMVMVTILSLTFLPAATSLFADRLHVQFKPSRLMPKIYTLVNKRKAFAVVIFLGMSGIFWANTANLEYFTDVVASNFGEDDDFTKTYVHLKERQGGAADELVIIEGDLTDPETLAYIRALEEDLMLQEPFVKSRAHVNSITVLLGAYEVLGNTVGAAPNVAGQGLQHVLDDYANNPGQLQSDFEKSQQQGSPYAEPYHGHDYVRDAAPTDRETIEADIAAMQGNIAWKPLIDFLYSKDGSITIIDVLVDDGGSRDLDTLASIQKMMEDAISRHEHERPDDVQVYVNGVSTGLYQYLDYSFTWLQRLFLVSAVVGTILMFAFTRSIRATLAFLTPMLFTTTWFLGILPFFGILVGIGMIVPIIFITSIGSDYAAHLSWNILKTGRPRQIYETTGKAILFSTLTDFGAFFIFSFSYLQGVRSQALATSLAILAIFVVTMLVVPLFFNREPGVVQAARKLAAKTTKQA